MKRLISQLLIAGLLFTFLPVVQVQASEDDRLLEYAKSFQGVPYKMGGSTPSGFDCSGFLIYVFKEIGISLPRTAAEQYNIGTKVERDDLQPGDLVFFSNTYKPGISHSGIYVGDNSFISATSSKGIDIVSLSNSYWGPKYAGAKRVITAGEYKDIPQSHFAYEAVKQLSTQQIILGFEDQTFKPADSVTRGQAAAIINRVLKESPKSLNSYHDVPASSRFAKDIAAIKELGIINGFPDGTFRPESTMTRAQMAVIVDKAFKLGTKNVTSAAAVYADVPSSYWAHDAIVLMNKIDITTGFKTETYRIADSATRADFSAAIYNALHVK
ncbi:hypothetical protein D0469_09220 [Peribacillus saganii]|uniref:Hydrolase Nlp/P60 n=1 Tax=Peribacillus saganii TaxID=2303992 RepID=A0A372LP85_9BACI|nr:C40 family peptidase [Peribacillus saganii]RFU69554.1 hypothetical protein D0469_09220 [Peribacillus saganii]